MTKKTATPAPFEQTAYQRAEFDAFRRMLTISEGTFSLSVAICNSPVLRDHLIEHITSEIETIEVVRVEKDTPDVFGLVRQQIREANPRAIFIIDMERALAGDRRDRVLQGLNASREQWRSTYTCPVVFWLPDYLVSLLMTQARDLWSWVSHSFEFVSEQTTPSLGLRETFIGDLELAGNLDVHEKHFRIAELEQRIADVGEKPEGRLKEYVFLWLSELAYLYYSLGELDHAVQILREMLESGRKLGRLLAVAITSANLGTIYRERGDLDEAEKMLNKALEINQKLGRLEGIANQYGGLGAVYLTRGDLDKAEEMCNKALVIYQRLGRFEDMATEYGDLGVIYRRRGDLSKAEKMHDNALEIHQKLGRLDGAASQYASLGAVYLTRGDLDRAEEMYNKALQISQKLGRLGGVAREYGNLGLIYRIRGDLDEAERMHNNALEIEQKLGRSEGIAGQYANLGLVYKARGNLARARESWEKALTLFQIIGARDEIQDVQTWIADLPKNAQ